MKDASHYITVLWVAHSLYLFPKLQSSARMIKVNIDVSKKNPYDVLEISYLPNKTKKQSKAKKQPKPTSSRTGIKVIRYLNTVCCQFQKRFGGCFLFCHFGVFLVDFLFVLFCLFLKEEFQCRNIAENI